MEGQAFMPCAFYLFQLPELFLPFAWLYLLALQPSTKGPSLLGFLLDFIVFLPTQAGTPLHLPSSWAHVLLYLTSPLHGPFLRRHREACARAQHGIFEWKKMLSPLNLTQRFLPFFLLCLYFWVPDICLSASLWGPEFTHETIRLMGRELGEDEGRGRAASLTLWLRVGFCQATQAHGPLISSQTRMKASHSLPFSFHPGHKPKLLLFSLNVPSGSFRCDFKFLAWLSGLSNLASILFQSFFHPPGGPLSSLFPKHVVAFFHTFWDFARTHPLTKNAFPSLPWHTIISTTCLSEPPLVPMELATLSSGSPQHFQSKIYDPCLLNFTLVLYPYFTFTGDCADVQLSHEPSWTPQPQASGHGSDPRKVLKKHLM